jgi:uncharacterized protein
MDLDTYDLSDTNILFKLAVTSRYDDKDYESAKKYYLMLLDIEPKNSDTMVDYASLCEDMDDIDTAIEYYLKAIDLYNEKAMGKLGHIYQCKRIDYDLMEKYYNMAINYDNFSIVGNFGVYYYRTRNDYSRAVRYFEMGIKDNNCNLSMYYLGDYYWTINNDFLNAKKYYEMSIKENEDEDSMYELGMIYYKIKNYQKAIEYLLMALQYNPEDVDILNGLGRVYTNKEDYETAKKYYDDASELDEDDDTILGYGMIEYYKGNYDKALDMITRVYNSDSGNDEALYYLGKYHCNVTKNYEVMESYWLKAIEFKNSDAMLDLGRYYDDIVKLDEKMKLYVKMAVKWHNIDALLYYAKYHKSFNVNNSITLYKEAIKLGSDNASFKLADLYINFGHMDDALDIYDKLIKKGNIEAMIKLGDVYASYNWEILKAEKYYKMALNKGSKEVNIKMGLMYMRHSYLDKYIKLALQHFSTAYENGEDNALIYLGGTYMKLKNYDEAEKYYKIAADMGNYDGMIKLGNHYNKHHNDFETAKKFYKIALDNGVSSDKIKLDDLKMYYHFNVYRDTKEVNIFKNKSNMLSKEIDCEVCLDEKIEGIPFECAHYVCKKCYISLHKSSCPFCRMDFGGSRSVYF